MISGFPTPWRVERTSRARKTGGGYNYHIRAANDNYVAERIITDALAQYIVRAVNEREATGNVKPPDELERLMITVDAICAGLDPQTVGGAVNWGDLGAREVTRVFGANHGSWLRVVIEEAAPGEQRLIDAVRSKLAEYGWDVSTIEIDTEW